MNAFKLRQKDIKQKLLNQRENILSSRYKLLTTQDILNKFLLRGFYINSFAQSKNNEHGAHILRLRHNDYKIGNDYIEIIISNSYDGSIPFTISWGYHRKVCNNGLHLGSTAFKSKIKHVGSDFYDQVYADLNKALKDLDRIKNLIFKLKTHQLTKKQAVEFGHNVLKFRLKNVKNLFDVNINEALNPIREADKGHDLFTILNILQEKCLGGGIHYRTESTYKDRYGVEKTFKKRQVTKAIFRPQTTVKVNEFIFERAVELLEAV